MQIEWTKWKQKSEDEHNKESLNKQDHGKQNDTNWKEWMTVEILDKMNR